MSQIQILTAIVAASVGATLKWLVPAIAEWLRLRKQTKNLLGEWESEYQGIDEPPNTWISEQLVLSLDFFTGRIKIKNANSSAGYDYTAYGVLKNKIHIIGDWESVRPGSPAHGCFVQTISAQGDRMFGYWVGPCKTHTRRYGRWVLTRKKSDMEAAKKTLDEMRKPNLT